MKKSKTKVADGKLLTETELELMTILWKLGEGSVADVIEQLPKERDLAYTSVSTIMRILEQKEILKTRKEGRGHIYTPQLKKNDFEATTVKHVVERVFDGTPVALVRQLLDSVKLDEKDLKELKNLIDQAGGRK
ncbi:MAG: transcriptional regulator [Bdellovibrio sp. CG10_big_fil_rev_8_21_14_0_10_47_8]|nr:MAG: transcriptional regulator [Bdellovibrio sp. CG10_big_fil_rev_8_21_14_0_10_47_8]